MGVDFSNMGAGVTGRLKGGLPRCRFCQNPHNRQVAAVFDFNLRLASHTFMHPLWLCLLLKLLELEIVALENG